MILDEEGRSGGARDDPIESAVEQTLGLQQLTLVRVVQSALVSRRHRSQGGSGFWNGQAVLSARFQPQFDRNLGLGDGLCARVAMRRARPQIGHVGDPARVLGRPEQVDMVMRLVHAARF